MAALFLKLFNMSMAASWLILAVIVLRLVLKRAPKWIHCILWALVAVRLLCPISIESALSLVPSSEPLPPEVVQFDPHPAIHSGVTIIDNAVNPVIGETFAASPTASVNPLYVWTEIAGIIWAVGVVVLLAYAAISYFRLRRVVSESAPLCDNIYLCDHIQTPFILGLFRPRVYLPSDLSDAQMQSVVAHERAHLARRDHWWKPLGWILLTVYWFNPLCWVAYILLCRDIELACDEKVIRDMGVDDRKAYSQALLSCSIPRRLVSACPLAFGEVGVKERIRGVLNYKKPAFWVIALAVVACIGVAVCFLTNPKVEPIEDTLAPEQTAILSARILEIHDGTMLVEPLEGSTELQSADRFSVPMQHMAASPEPQTGDLIEITYNGEILETYPASLGHIFDISVVIAEQKTVIFSDLFGLSGQSVETTENHFTTRSYFVSDMNGSEVCIAESFGFEIDDYIVDLDGDGVTELVCNCQYGGDGHESVYVYRRNGNVIERGWLDLEHKQLDMVMPANWKNWGVNSTAERYIPETGIFEIRYDTDHGTEVATTSHLSHFTFEEYARLPKDAQLPTPITAENLFASMPSNFHFLSGAGGWQTELYWYGNGKFSGIFEDADAGEIYRCEFAGAFSAPRKVRDLLYSTHMTKLTYAEPGITTTENDIKITTAGPYGLEGADELWIYLPGYPVSELPESVLGWIRGGASEFWDGRTPDTLPFFVLYNLVGEEAFFSADWSAFAKANSTQIEQTYQDS